MLGLGALLKDSDPAEAQRWRERAAGYDNADAMFGLGVLLEDSDPAEARRWYEQAAAHDHAGAMFGLGRPAQRRATPPRPGAGGSGRPRHDHAGAMYNLGVLLEDE